MVMLLAPKKVQVQKDKPAPAKHHDKPEDGAPQRAKVSPSAPKEAPPATANESTAVGSK
jgi:hypothetical protein